MKRKTYWCDVFYAVPEFTFFLNEVISNSKGFLSANLREEQASFNPVKLYSEEG